MTSRTSRTVAVPSVLVLAAAGFLGGCGAEEPDDVVYCVDENNVVVDEDRCDDRTGTTSNGGIFYYMMGRYSSGLQPGTQLNSSQSTARFRSTDTAARTKAGVPGTGKIATGKSSGFGTGSGKSGGFGGGSKGSGGS